jgi:hypothetical protein
MESDLRLQAVNKAADYRLQAELRPSILTPLQMHSRTPTPAA